LPGPLPAEAVYVDLVQASVDDPGLAAELWGPFLAYVNAKEDSGLVRQLKNYVLGIAVRLEIPDAKLHQAVTIAIRGSKLNRIRLQEG
jgi:hypothetical protein